MGEHAPLAARNQHVQALRRLARRRTERDEQQVAVVEGRSLVAEVLARSPARTVVYADPGDEQAAAIASVAEQRGVRWHRVTAEVLAGATGSSSSQGLVAVVGRPTWSLADLGPGIVLAVEELADPGNLGTLLRTATAVGAGGVLATGGVDPFAPKVVRAARAAQLSTPVVVVDDLVGAAAELGRPLLVADAQGEPLWSAPLADDAVVVVGNEARGASAAVRGAAVGSIALPMPGGTESLNAAVAASVLAYEWLRRRS